MPNNTAPLPEWEIVLSAAPRLQDLLAALVSDSATARHAVHSAPREDDPALTDLRACFADVLDQLEAVAGLKAAREHAPVQALRLPEGLETGVRQLIREQPLEIMVLVHRGATVTVPSLEEMLRIRGVLILKRNATRDYLDFAALATHLGEEKVVHALKDFDRLYPQSSGESSLQQLLVQLATPLPYDLEQTQLSEYKHLEPRWHDWREVVRACERVSVMVFDRVCDSEVGATEGPST